MRVGGLYTSLISAGVQNFSISPGKPLGTVMSRPWAVRRDAGFSGTRCADDASHAVSPEAGRSLRSLGTPQVNGSVSPLQEHVMRPLRYSINVTLDGCCDHRAIPTDEDLHRYWAENLAQADALLFGRVTYKMMEAAWRPPAQTGVMPDWMQSWMQPFARTIHAAKKYVVSSTLDRVDWNAE